MSRIVLVNQSSTPDDAGSGNAQLFIEGNELYQQVGTGDKSKIALTSSLNAVSAASLGKYSTGWVTSVASTTVANGATLTVPHNLGTSDIIVQVYANGSASDSGAQQVVNQEWPGTGNFFYGAQIKSPSTTDVVVQLAAQGYITGNSSGGGASTPSFAGAYIKIVVIG